MNKTELISLHGGHSGQYCCHAADRLEDIILRYMELGFKTVGITEHAPPRSNDFLYPDEKAQHLTAADLNRRFKAYMDEMRSLQKKYAGQIRLFAGMETETYTGSLDHMKGLVEAFKPDYLVGSVHHVNDICFDYSRKEYDRAMERCGSADAMYENYFDLQYDMIRTLVPFVVGHFDLIRIYDPDYENRLLQPAIKKKVLRNLKLIKSLGLVLDFNLRPLARGEKDPYVKGPVLDLALELGISLVPGDDSHGVDQAGLYVETAVGMLEEKGANTRWPDPVLLVGPKNEDSK